MTVTRSAAQDNRLTNFPGRLYVNREAAEDAEDNTPKGVDNLTYELSPRTQTFPVWRLED